MGFSVSLAPPQILRLWLRMTFCAKLDKPMISRRETENTGGEPQPRRIFYGWYIVAAGTTTSFTTMAIFTVGLSVFIKDVQDEMGWTMAAISLGFSLKQLETGILAPVSGYLIDRLGPRIMAVAGTIVMTIGLLLFSQMHSLWMFYVAAMVIAIGQGMGSMMAYTTPLMHWFRRKRGRASSFLATGRGLAYAGAIPITFLLAHFGWRPAVAIAAIAFIAINLPMALVLRHRPGPYGYLPDGDRAPSVTGQGGGVGTQTQESEGFTVKEAVRSASFWLLLLSFAVYSFGLQVQLVHLIPHMRHSGFSAQGAALIIGIYGVVQTGGRLTCGWIGDMVGRHRMLMAAFLLMGMGWLAMAYISPSALWAVAIFIIVYGAGQAAHTVAAQTIVADFFGPQRFASIRGIMNPISVLGGVSGPIFAGFMFDTYGSYQVAMVIVGLLTFLDAPAVFLAGKPTLAGKPAPARQTTYSR